MITLFSFGLSKEFLKNARLTTLTILFFCFIPLAVISLIKIHAGFYEGWVTILLGGITVWLWILWFDSKEGTQTGTLLAYSTIALYLLTVMSSFYHHSYEDKVLVLNNKTTYSKSLLANPFQKRVVVEKVLNSVNSRLDVISGDKNPVYFTLGVKAEIFAESGEVYKMLAIEHPKGSKYSINPFVSSRINQYLTKVASTMHNGEFSDRILFENKIKERLSTLTKLPLKNVQVEISRIEIDLSRIVYN